MEFNNQYLTYNEYVELGGTLEETPFNLLEFGAQKVVDKYTFGRLVDLESQINEVKLCIFELIKISSESLANSNRDKSISSETIDGYSVSYAQSSEALIEAQTSMLKETVKTYLSECYLEDGTPYLYCGVGK